MNDDLKGLDARETENWAVDHGLKPFQGRQIRQWLFKKQVGSFEEMTNLLKSVRHDLAEKVCINHLTEVKTLLSEDGTRKYLFKLADGHLIETVLIPDADHATLCISSQAGCAMACRFCVTARQGFKRNLSAAEIVDQVIQVKRSMENPDFLTNIVLMGMGEPLANYEAVTKAVTNLTSPNGMYFSTGKVTLSTCGLVPQIRQLGKDITVNLAVSLNAADDETRSFLMPVNKQYPLKSLMAACKDFPRPNRRMITFEYILIKGINDRRQDAENVIKLLSGIRGKINLIPLNAGPGDELSSPDPENIFKFQKILTDNHLTAMIRKSRGQDIQAACGQLSGNYAP